MSLSMFDVRHASDRALLDTLRNLSERSAGIEADLLVHLGEVDARGLALELGFGSLFGYCTEELHFAESIAFHRITAARAARRFPQILERIRSRELHLSGLRLLLPQMTMENCNELLDLARHQSKRAIEMRLADRAPRPDAPAQLRRLPERVAVMKPALVEAQASPVPAPAPVATSARPSTEPLGASRYKVQFTAGAELHSKLREAQALMRHQIPDGNLGRIFERALETLLRELRRVRFAETLRPRAGRAEVSAPAPRNIPAAIRRAVAKRDGECCTFESHSGRRCGVREMLEFHHLVPFASSRRHRVDEITLRCRAHNVFAATQDFGAAHMANFRRDRGIATTRPGASS